MKKFILKIEQKIKKNVENYRQRKKNKQKT